MSNVPRDPRSPLNRRDFLRAATAAAVAPMIVPRHVIARSQATPPSDRRVLRPRAHWLQQRDENRLWV
jgi:hypothetical protein